MLSEKDKNELVSTFRYKLNRLHDYINSNNTNELIEAAGIVRDLLISDENGLVGTLYKAVPSLKSGRRRQRLQFRAIQYASSAHNHTPEVTWFTGDGFTPDTGVPYTQPAKNYTRDDFLKLPVISVEGYVLTTKDIILFAANKLGGRHWDRSREGSNINPILYDIHEQFTLGGTSPAVQTLNGIISIVIPTLDNVDDKLKEAGY